jgi:formiminotetrahydrofolate cyclodeaminase
MRHCADAIEAAPVVATFGNANAASDVVVALELLGAAVRGAQINVEINLAGLEDRGHAERVRHAAGQLRASCDTGATAARADLPSAE